MGVGLDLTALQREIVIELLIHPGQRESFFKLKDAFEESDLPFRVDLFVWDEIPSQFQENIRQEYVVLQTSFLESILLWF